MGRVMDDIMDRVRAARAIVESEQGRSRERMRAFVFLSLMHPEIPLSERLRMAGEIAAKE